MASLLAGLVACLLTLIALPVEAAPPPAPSGSVTAISINHGSRKSVYDAYQTILKPALAVPIGWTGNVSTCDAGQPSAAASAATLATVNFFREFAGLAPVTFDAGLSAPAQQAALMMLANGTLSHSPDATWDCYTASGALGAGSSNLASGNAGANAIAAYMRDDGGSNAAVGHRRWVLYPPLATMGTGSTCCTDALYVFGTQDDTQPSPTWVPWPSAGYFPQQLEPSGRWSLTANDKVTDFSGATVSVSRNGVDLPVQVQPVNNLYGNRTIVWQVDPQYGLGLADRAYDVKVENIIKNGVPVSYSYTVTLFDASIDADQTIAFASLPDKTYGDAPITVNATATSGLPVTFSSTTPAVCTTSGSRGSVVTLGAAGTCTVRANQPGDAVHNPAPEKSQTFSVDKRTLTVQPDTQLKPPGTANPPLSVNYAGFAADETYATSGLSGAPACTTTAVTSSPVGSYPIACTTGTLASANYSFTMEPGVLLVNVGGLFTAVTPKRLLDSRDGTGGYNTKWDANTTRTLTVAGGTTGIPADATAVVLNVTATEPTNITYLTAWPTGQPKPLASNLNLVAGQTIPNAVTVKVGTDGKISIYNNAGSTHVIADIVGYYRNIGTGGLFTAVTPKRLLDSRDGTGGYNTKWDANTTRTLTVAGGTTGIPADATAVVLNVTATEPTNITYLTAWPTGQPKPLASNLNLVAGQTIPNAVTVKVGTDGKISIYNNAGSTHVIADIVGYYRNIGTGGLFTAVTPKRLLDSRDGTGGYNTKWDANTTRTLTVAGGTTGIPADATAVVLNVTATEPTNITYLTAWPTGQPKPLASNLNLVAGQTIPNAVTVKVGTDGKISIYNNAGSTHVIADIVGYYR